MPEPGTASSLAVARSYSPPQSCSSTWPCLLRAGDYLHAGHCAADKEEDGTDSCVDGWPHSEENFQCKSKKKKRKGPSLCSSQVSSSRAEPQVWLCLRSVWSCLTDCAFSTGNERRRQHARGEHAGLPLAVSTHVPNQRRLVLVSVWRQA